ncbi:MAG: PKD domain-containing protein [Candidatus Bipolaricaulota bacterium]|nr:PKD domain-containing protein [Candidatus Bipolaricaulota bacterium]
MRKGIRTGIFGLLIAAASAWAASAAWQADFTPSTFNPGVGNVVNFAVCETCLGSGGAYRYLWDFNSDGVVDLNTDSTVAACTFDATGFYEVKLTVQDLGGREVTRSKGIYVGPVPAFGIRQVILETDGTVFVSISIVVNSAAVALGLVEGIPAGWQLEIVDAGNAMTRVNTETRQLEVAWMSQAEAGDELTFTYRLYSNYATQTRQLSGELSGYIGGVRFTDSVCGELAVP